MTQARIERQAETVARLARALRFELLVLRRMRARHADGSGPADAHPRFASIAEVYAAALLRRTGTEGG